MRLTVFAFWQDAYRLQLKLFLYEVKQQQLLSGVRTFLKVYSTISVGKLATYMEVDEPTLRSVIIRIWCTLMSGKCSFHTFYGKMYLIICRTILMSYKHKTHAVDSDGKVVSNADIDFSINDVCVSNSFVISYYLYIGFDR